MASPRISVRRRMFAAVAAALVLATGFLAFPTPAIAATSPSSDSAVAAANWLAARMPAGYLELFPGKADVGLTVDAMLAFAATGTNSAKLADTAAWLKTDSFALGEYLQPGFYEGIEGYAAGSLAKVLLGLQVAGSPTTVTVLKPDFATEVDVDVLAELLKLQQPNGLFWNPDPAVKDTNINAFTQSLAILALQNTPAGAPGTAVTFLTGTLCPGGAGYPLLFGQATCNGHVDGTAMVMQAMLATGNDCAAARATGWLRGVQDGPTGGFFDTANSQGINTNSTGLATQALHAFGQDAAADQGNAFIRDRQVADGPDRGGIAYNAKDPADPDNTGFLLSSAPRATAQAILGLSGVPLGDLDRLNARHGPSKVDCSPPPAAGPVLPKTGSATGRIVAIGAVLLLFGLALVFLVRRRPAPAGVRG